MGILRLVLKVAAAILLLLVAVAGIAYAADYGLEAQVQDHQCLGGLDKSGNTVTVVTKVGGISYTATGLDASACAAVQPGNYVVYHVRSHRTSLYDDDSKAHCIWDTEGGLNGCPA